jgi:ABC-2 type transport system permease protein
MTAMTSTVSARSRSWVYWAASDSLTLIGRSVRMSMRSIDAMITAAALPVMLLLLFVYVFGGAIRVSGRYIDYVVPGIILLCAGFGSVTTAVSVCQDMTSGAVERFRSLPIVSSALLTGHVIASVLRNLASTAIVIGVALLIGFRPHAGVAEWLGALGVLVLFMAAISWLAAC